MRFYAQSGEDANFNLNYGYYVVASLHADYEGWPCTNAYESLEFDENLWLARVGNLTSSPYFWIISDSEFNWHNGVDGTKYIGSGGSGFHRYESNGQGPIIWVSGNH